MIELRAKPGCCEEAALGLPFYAPCNEPAKFILRWKGRSDPQILVCEMCADHNVKNRGGKIVGPADVQPDPAAARMVSDIADAIERFGDDLLES